MKLCVRIHKNEVGRFTAQCPSLPGCMCFGTTRQEAGDKLEEAIRGYIAAVSNFVPEELTQEVVEV